jgi:diguanylate cyclase (GGDEF)-like protein
MILKVKNSLMPLTLAGGVVLVVLLGIFDYYTGVETPLSIFYLIPVAFSTWMLGARVGCLFCLLSTGSYIATHIRWDQVPQQPLSLYVNSASRLVFFLLVCFILSKLKSFLLQEMRLARTDPLTGVANRLYFYEKAQEILDRAKEGNQPVTIAYLDIDDFKIYNDLWGHREGDDILSLITSFVASHLRKTDLMARLGGDEFVILLPETGQAQARVVLEKIRNRLSNPSRRGDVKLTLSFGVATFMVPPDNVDLMVGKADRLMYEVKKGGKNNIIYQEIQDPS